MKQDTLRQEIGMLKNDFPARWEVTVSTGVNGQHFPHLVIDNFFTDQELQELRRHQAEVKNAEIKISHNHIKSNGEVKSEILDTGFLQGIDATYLNPLLAILSCLSKKKPELYEFSDFHLITTGPDYQHQIHDDIPKKLLSVVVYLNPEKNNGTFIHKDRDTPSPVGEVEWKQNRAFIFSRKDRQTWHSYAANHIDDRFCAIYNLNTYKAYKAHWAEGNYLKFLEKRLKNE